MGVNKTLEIVYDLASLNEQQASQLISANEDVIKSAESQKKKAKRKGGSLSKQDQKIEKRSNKYDYHVRSGSPYFREPGTEKTPVNRPDEYFLTYDHKINGKLKKCKIAPFDKNHMLFKLTPNKINELHKHFFPYCAEWMKNLAVEA